MTSKAKWCLTDSRDTWKAKFTLFFLLSIASLRISYGRGEGKKWRTYTLPIMACLFYHKFRISKKDPRQDKQPQLSKSIYSSERKKKKKHNSMMQYIKSNQRGKRVQGITATGRKHWQSTLIAKNIAFRFSSFF